MFFTSIKCSLKVLVGHRLAAVLSGGKLAVGKVALPGPLQGSDRSCAQPCYHLACPLWDAKKHECWLTGVSRRQFHPSIAAAATACTCASHSSEGRMAF
jgi:hypothetical protein